MDNHELESYINRLLSVDRFKDYAPNGLQVEGRPLLRKIVTGVTASQALIEAAQAAGADTVLVHHGYFWRGEDPRLVGMKRRRLAFLLKHDLNLLAYHLPLDAHPALGNNAQLALKLGFVQEGVFGDQDLGQYGILPDTQPLGQLAEGIGEKLGRLPLVIGEPAREVRRIAWCTGAAQGYFQDALSLGIDAFLTGEISEPSVHMARETGVAFISAGHHATEKFGIQALGEHLHRQFGLEHQFIDIPNPV